jgi:hypothetical protein
LEVDVETEAVDEAEPDADLLEEGVCETDLETDDVGDTDADIEDVWEGLTEVDGVGEEEGGIIEQHEGYVRAAHATSSSVREVAFTITQFSPKKLFGCPDSHSA